MKNSQIIGILNNYNDTRLVTIEDVIEESNNITAIYTMKKYCDWRYNTNLTRFNYDPFTGEKINWKQLKKLYYED